jgi:hypothetical protein
LGRSLAKRSNPERSLHPLLALKLSDRRLKFVCVELAAAVGSEAASEKGMKIAKARRNHGRSYVFADYFRIGRD